MSLFLMPLFVLSINAYPSHFLDSYRLSAKPLLFSTLYVITLYMRYVLLCLGILLLVRLIHFQINLRASLIKQGSILKGNDRIFCQVESGMYWCNYLQVFQSTDRCEVFKCRSRSAQLQTLRHYTPNLDSCQINALEFKSGIHVSSFDEMSDFFFGLRMANTCVWCPVFI